VRVLNDPAAWWFSFGGLLPVTAALVGCVGLGRDMVLCSSLVRAIASVAAPAMLPALLWRQGLVDSARHVIRCHLTQETMGNNAFDDVGEHYPSVPTWRQAAAQLAPGLVNWDSGYFTSSVALALVLGALTAHAFRVSAPWTMSIARRLFAALSTAPGWSRAPASVSGSVVAGGLLRTST